MRRFARLCISPSRRVLLGLAVALGACGRISLGSVSLEDGPDASAGSGGGSGLAGTGGAIGGSGAGKDGGPPGGATNGLSAATGLGGAGGVAGSSGGSDGVSGSGGEAGASQSALDAGVDAGEDTGPGPRPVPPSCRDENPQCGIATHRGSCCESLPVTGGSFELPSEPVIGASSPATVASFRLDRFEVTVGRMREFIEDYDEWRAAGQPEQGLGEHPLIPGSGWQVAEFSPQLPASAEEFEQRLRSCIPTPFSTYAEASSEQVPLNCATWFEAAAFCAWDGGRLPTLREFAYAAAGGSRERVYPWGAAPAPSRVNALFGCSINTFEPNCTIAEVTPVGARPAGAGFFGQDDLSGSMSEWVLDAMNDVDAGATRRRWRDGNWLTPVEFVESLRNDAPFPALPPGERIFFIGMRCARDE